MFVPCFASEVVPWVDDWNDGPGGTEGVVVELEPRDTGVENTKVEAVW